MPGPLAGLTVLDLTHYVAGPFCTKLLADYGADVIKVERPDGGDPARRLGPFPDDLPHPEKSGVFLALNTNKRSLTLNLKTEAGRSILRALVQQADVLVENFHPRVMPGLGLHYEALAAINPRLVMTSISNFGQTGPYRDFKATEITLVALGGWQYIVGDPGREPVKPGGNQAQFQGGLQAAVATMTALWHQRATGTGQWIDISIMEAVASILESTHWQYTALGQVRVRNHSRYGTGHPLTILPCRDGYVAATIVGHGWESAAVLMDLPELIADPRLEQPNRLQMADEIDAILATWLMQHDRHEIFHRGQEMRIAFGLVPTIDEVVADPHLSERGFFVPIEHPAAGELRYPGAPFRLAETPWRPGRAPLLGEHTSAILVDRVSYSRQDLVRLRALGTI